MESKVMEITEDGQSMFGTVFAQGREGKVREQEDGGGGSIRLTREDVGRNSYHHPACFLSAFSCSLYSIPAPLISLPFPAAIVSPPPCLTPPPHLWQSAQ